MIIVNHYLPTKKAALPVLALGMAWLTIPAYASEAQPFVPPEAILSMQPIGGNPLNINSSTNSNTTSLNAADFNNASISAPLPGVNNSWSNQGVINQTPTMSAQEARQALFNSLMGQEVVARQLQQQQAQTNNLDSNSISSNANLPSSSTEDPAMNAGPSQILAGGGIQPTVRQDIRRNGYSNVLSGILSFGATLLTGRSATGIPASPMGLPMYGLGATGFGVRNGFRY